MKKSEPWTKGRLEPGGRPALAARTALSGPMALFNGVGSCFSFR